MSQQQLDSRVKGLGANANVSRLFDRSQVREDRSLELESLCKQASELSRPHADPSFPAERCSSHRKSSSRARKKRDNPGE